MSRRRHILLGVELRGPRIAGVSFARGLGWLLLWRAKRIVWPIVEAIGRRVG